ncbi:hypothetical protein QYF68_26790 [Mycolicibacterium austroafricanum]|uniref:Uncharacterized protein n=1 Tax=Mycolicibacterium austroafricanum TaxID=39687 RepID=A0ABT8HM66_MYCAO|nr:hypothetical protein [Mycolicibacterium austroafricanum]MDN4521402.1 hypothetical protein [Mycolicibacterium austroafricanum]
MNPLHIPRTILACVGVVIDTAVQMRTQQRDYEAAVRAAAPKAELGHSVAPSCPRGGPCRDCDRTQDGCVQIWGPAEDHAEALRRNWFITDPAVVGSAAPSPAIPPADDTDPAGVVDGPPASATPAGSPSELTRGNLIEAAATIRAAVPYADDIDIAAHLYALADRLDAAARVYPTP